MCITSFDCIENGEKNKFPQCKILPNAKVFS
jgi:hypothetical protein